MTEFIVLCAAMLVVGALLILRPLIGKTAVTQSVDDTAEAPPAKTAALIIGLVLPLAAIGLYPVVSNYPWKNPQVVSANSGAANRHAENAGAMKDMVANLEARLAENPDDLRGWQMLGRTYLITGEPRKAVGAYERALAATSEGEQGELKLQLAEALILTEDAESMQRGREIVDAALAEDPTSQIALWYSGVLALNDGDEEKAKSQWLALFEQDPPPEIRELLTRQLTALGVEVPGATDARAAAPRPAAMTGSGSVPSSPAPTGRQVEISVSLDPELASRLGPGVPLFVSARQPGIPGPPLAAVRITTDDLPAKVVLSDANSMIEGRNLSSVDDVEVIARVAFGGTAMTESGDLIGTAVHARGAAPKVSVVIDTVAP